ncbi:DUF5610 domain-containing protein [Thalassotalea fusca]
MDKLTHLPGAGSYAQLLPKRSLSTFNGNLQSPHNLDVANAELVALSSDKMVSMRIVLHSVNQRFAQHNGFEEAKFEVIPESPSSFDSDTVTETVFGFIKESLMRAKENGKSDIEIQEMFDQAREGITQGFGQALQELSELNKLTEEIQLGVAKSQEEINHRLDELYASFFPNSISNEEVKPSLNKSNDLRESNANKVEDNVVEKYSANYRYNDNRESALSIMTNDGDEIHINFYSNELTAVRFGYHSNSSSGNEKFAISAGYGKETGYSIAIKGELDEDEREAIATLLQDIDKVQESFYNGNVSQAYEYAQSIGFDSNELSSMSLDLTQKQTFKAKQTYQEVAAIGHEKVDRDKSLRPVLDFVAEFRALKEKASLFVNINNQQFLSVFHQLSIVKFAQEPDKAKKINETVNELDV